MNKLICGGLKGLAIGTVMAVGVCAPALAQAKSIQGYTYYYPGAPVCEFLDSCANPAPRLLVLVKDASGKVVRKVHSNQNAQFAVNVKPGTYSLLADPKVCPAAKPTIVTVTPGTLVAADVYCDSGIR